MKPMIGLGMWMLLSFVITGCISGYYGQYDDRQVSGADTLQTPAMSKQEIIALTKEGISEDVIISQMKATGSHFTLSSDDIIELKKAGVSEKVISAMIKTGESSRKARRVRSY